MRMAGSLRALAVLLLLATPLVAQDGATVSGTAPALAGDAAQDAPGAQQAGDEYVAETELERQTRAVSAQLRCVVCQGLSIQDSPSTLAQEMRAVVREQLAAGSTPDEVKQYFVANYGEWVLLEPEPSGFNLLVYVLPFVMLLGGAAFVYVTARGMTRRKSTEPSPGSQEEIHL